MSQMTDYLENKIIDDVLRTPQVFVHLYLDDPTDADVGVEVSGTGYVEQEATFGVGANGVTTTTADLNFPTATADWGDVSHFVIRDASDNPLIHGQFTAPKTVNSGDTFKISTGNLTVTMA